MNSQHQLSNSFFNLNPNTILKCTEEFGLIPTGEIFQLNSYENRVFDIKLENGSSVIAKFFRPHRWNYNTIKDEHEFCFDLHHDGLPVGLPIKNIETHETVFNHEGIHYCFYNKVRGRMMQEILPHQFEHLGTLTARLHNTGEKSFAQHRNSFGPSLDFKWNLLDQMHDQISPEVRSDYLDIAEQIFQDLDFQLENKKMIRIHGDLHRGNLLDQGNNEIAVVDFDDFINGPTVQDFWMIFPETNFIDTKEFEDFLIGYTHLRHFDEQELNLVHLIRGYRMINYAGWILNRWNDPSFKKIFPEFNTYRYWAEETDALRKLFY